LVAGGGGDRQIEVEALIDRRRWTVERGEAEVATQQPVKADDERQQRDNRRTTRGSDETTGEGAGRQEAAAY
jgi:hypothetical protein